MPLSNVDGHAVFGPKSSLARFFRLKNLEARLRGGHPKGDRGGRWRREARQQCEAGSQAQAAGIVVGGLERPWSCSARPGPAPVGTPRFLLGRLMATPGALNAFAELRDGTRIWIIAEADRSVTTILLSEEYERGSSLIVAARA